MSLKWFKHYNTASRGDTLQQFIANRDYESVTLFWMLLEFLSRNESEGKRGSTQIELKFLCREINMKPSKLLKLLSRFSQIALEWNLSFTETKLEFRVDNWLELQENKKSKKQKRAEKNPLEVRSKKLDVRSKKKEYSTEAPKTAFAVSPISVIRDCFLDSYKKEFGRAYPGWGAKENSQATAWLKSVDLETARNLCELFPKWNDPWVTRQGHPFGILVSQYVQVDAWAKGHRQLVSKIAKGKAIELVDISRQIKKQEFEHELQEKIREHSPSARGSGGALPDETEEGISRPAIKFF